MLFTVIIHAHNFQRTFSIYLSIFDQRTNLNVLGDRGMAGSERLRANTQFYKLFSNYKKWVGSLNVNVP